MASVSRTRHSVSWNDSIFQSFFCLCVSISSLSFRGPFCANKKFRNSCCAEVLFASAAKMKRLCGGSDQILNAARSINKRGLLEHNLWMSLSAYVCARVKYCMSCSQLSQCSRFSPIPQLSPNPTQPPFCPLPQEEHHSSHSWNHGYFYSGCKYSDKH